MYYPPMIRVGIIIFSDIQEWGIVVCPHISYFVGDNRVYVVFQRRNMVWGRRDYERKMLEDGAFRGILHLADLDCDKSAIHGRMQSVVSGPDEGTGMPNPTSLPWGPRAWMIRVLLILQREFQIPLPHIPVRRLPAYIEQRSIGLNRNAVRFVDDPPQG